MPLRPILSESAESVFEYPQKIFVLTNSEDTNTRQTPLLVILGVVLALIVFDQLTKSRFARNRQPGPARGDIRLQADCLPEQIDSWQQGQFQAPSDGDEAKGAQWWWSHSWQYQRNSVTAVVSFDQLGLDVWHELTSCYRATGWELTGRTIHNGNMVQGRAWQYVAAELSRDTGERALLMFSAFFADGTPCLPEKISLNGKFIFEMNLLEKIQEAVVNQRHAQEQGFVSGRGTVLQCQVWCPVPSGSANEFLEDEIVALHVRSREQLRSEWLSQKRSGR